MRILIVEDDHRIASAVAEHLRRQRHVVDVAYDGASGLELAENIVYELLLVDVVLPKLDGLTLCTKLRERRSTTPIMMLTARDAVQDKVDALDAGADDYLTKPFDLAELAARIRALGRRGGSERTPVLCYGPIALNCASMCITVSGRQLTCTRTEFAILEAMLRSPRQLFTREMLLERVNPVGSETTDGSIKTHTLRIYGANSAMLAVNSQ